MSRTRIALFALGLSVVFAGVIGSGVAVATTAPKKVTTTTITVKATEFHFKLSKTFIAAPGTVIFKITNDGKEPHNFVVLSGINKTTPLILPKKTATLKIVFKKKGKVTYECSVGEHAEEGMLGTFLVK